MMGAVALSKLANAYLHARDFVIRQGFEEEIVWQQRRSIDSVTESDFLREAAWVVLSSGMRETVVRGCFDGISQAFLQWRSADEISSASRACITAALRHFNHAGKIEAIAAIAARVSNAGFARTIESTRRLGVSFLQELPFVGPVTSYHLAKNLGLDVVKPDRHLVRVAHAAGCDSPDDLCRELAALVGDKVAVIDIVIWRYATLVRDYLSLFR